MASRKPRTTEGEGICPDCGRYGNIWYRPVAKRLGCGFRCWTDADYDEAKRLHVAGMDHYGRPKVRQLTL